MDLGPVMLIRGAKSPSLAGRPAAHKRASARATGGPPLPCRNFAAARTASSHCQIWPSSPIISAASFCPLLPLCSSTQSCHARPAQRCGCAHAAAWSREEREIEIRPLTIPAPTNPHYRPACGIQPAALPSQLLYWASGVPRCTCRPLQAATLFCSRAGGKRALCSSAYPLHRVEWWKKIPDLVDPSRSCPRQATAP